MGPHDKAGFPISSLWTGKPWSSCLTKLGMLSPDSPIVHYLDVRRTNPNTFRSPRCHISNVYKIDEVFLSQPDLCVKPEAWAEHEAWPCAYCLCSTFSNFAGFAYSSMEGRPCHTNRIFCKLFIWLYKVHMCQYGSRSLDPSTRYRTPVSPYRGCTPVFASACMCTRLSSGISINHTSTFAFHILLLSVY